PWQPAVPRPAPQLTEASSAVAGARECLLGHLGNARAQPCAPRRVFRLVGKGQEPIGVEEIGVVAEDDTLAIPVHPDLPDSRPVSKEFLDRPRDVFEALGGIDPDAGSAPDRVDDTKADGFFRVRHRTVLRYDPLLPEAPAVLKGSGERTPVASASTAAPVPAEGSRTRTVVPRPSVLSIPSAPSCACTMCLTIASPSPVPPSARDRAFSTRKKRSVSRGRSSAGMPVPVSSTVISTMSACAPSPGPAEIAMRPPAGEYFMALSTRLIRTCCRRSASASTCGVPGSTRVVTASSASFMRS